MFRAAVAALIVGITLSLSAGPALADEVCVGCPSSTTTSTSTTSTTAPPQEAADPVQTMLGYLNDERRANGLPLFTLRGDVTEIAGGWSRHMADVQAMSHNDEYFSDATRSRLNGWALGENVATSPALRRAHEALMASAPHRQNVLDARFVVVGIGAVHAGGRWWITEDFLQPRPAPAAPAAAPAPAPPAAAPSRPAVPAAMSAPRTPPPTAVAPVTERPRAAAPPVQTLELVPQEEPATRAPSKLTTTESTSLPVGPIGLAMVAIWLVASASLTTAVRRRRDASQRRGLRERIGSLSPTMPVTG
jgi:hypothetical protein